jgi:alginate O-acetyltransferase complex protein AlgI
VVRDLHERRLSVAGFNQGARQLVIGLAQKVLIADALAPLADAAFGAPAGQLGSAAAWLGILAYTLQIYFDFAGYSNMAIGLARMMGIGFPRNFDYPYISASVTEFWRRWHLSLSQWFRDYLYLPLGGNRVSPTRTYANLAAVFLLCGLWHGASFTFIAWGAYHGLLLIAERSGLAAILVRLWRPLRHAYALLAVMIGWVLFRSADFAQVTAYLAALSGVTDAAGLGPLAPLWRLETRVALAAGIVCSLPLLPWLGRWFAARSTAIRLAGGTATVLGLGVLMLLSTAVLALATYKPFIYFRF